MPKYRLVKKYKVTKNHYLYVIEEFKGGFLGFNKTWRWILSSRYLDIMERHYEELINPTKIEILKE
jgi:hypothetical protein